jgi:hypothetical protein
MIFFAYRAMDFMGIISIYFFRYTKYLDSVQEKDGGFGSMFATSLAIQAKISTKVKTEFDIEAAWKNLKAAQKPDGSFGHSITFTGIVTF